MKIAIDASYTTNASARITLPEGKTWADVEQWYIKWDTLHIKWVGGSKYAEFSLSLDLLDGIDWKRPTKTSIYPIDENGETDYGTELAAD